jgi:hypothetical protein
MPAIRAELSCDACITTSLWNTYKLFFLNNLAII